MNDFTNFDNSTLLAKLRATLSDERQSLSIFLRYLAEVEARRLAAEAGYPSLFAFCTGALALKEGEAYSRIHAARLGRRFPAVLDGLTSGNICLTTIRLIGQYLSDDNVQDVLGRVAGLTTREVEKLAVTLAVQPASGAVTPPAQGPATTGGVTPLFAADAGPSSTPAPAKKVKPDRLRYVTPESVELRFTVNEALLPKLNRIKGLAMTKGISSKLEDLFDHVFEVYLDRCDPERRLGRKPASKSRRGKRQAVTGNPRYIPQAVKDIVYARDGGQCVFLTAAGHRCPARVGLEYEHRTPFALGGSSTDPAGIELLCKGHNRLAADRVFGAEHMAAAIERRRQGG